MHSLNIGCGPDTWGDVRIDTAYKFVKMQCKPTILADAHYLPFIKGSFDVVKASHVLEHLKNPFKALNEMVRVAAKEIILYFPTEWDILPFFFTPHFSTSKLAYWTRKRHLHLWIINPAIVTRYLKNRGWTSIYHKNYPYSLFFILEGGRKGKYFRFLTSRIRIPIEYEVRSKKLTTSYTKVS
ncbi:MAG TPA: class I SAM-dependent methyltransferase [Candidatus Sulfotelmatobacter sp.]|nr:class I SAM-dependent methyltransferase [Candidatus Sulfotelmatobacter sp.]